MEESLNEVIIKTQQNCNLLQVEIKKYQKILLELESDPKSSPFNLSDILHAKLIKLKAELAVQNSQSFSPPLNHPLAVSFLLYDQLNHVLEQHQTINQVHKVKINSLNEQIEDVENLVLEQAKLQETLEQRLKDLPNPPISDQDDDFVTSYSKELSANKNACDVSRRKLKKKMHDFLSRVFPPTSSPSSPFTEKVVPLHQLVEDLITLTMTKPENPYLELRAQHWPPHVELLLSYGVAVRHPVDINKVKLRDLHL